jgi:hypothetical protein
MMIEALRSKRNLAAQALSELRLAAISVAESSQDVHKRAMARAYADAAMAALGDISVDAILELFETSELDSFEP